MFRSLLCILVLAFYSCGDYAALEAIEDNRRFADSLYRAHLDSIKKEFKVECDSVYKMQYDIAVDSFKKLHLKNIKKLVDQ